jgi:hypothetical protein
LSGRNILDVKGKGKSTRIQILHERICAVGSLFEEDVCGTSETRRLCPANAGIFAAGS